MSGSKNSSYPHLKEFGLTANQEQFVINYCSPSNGFNATKAYASAFDVDLEKNYESAMVSGSQLLRNSKVRAAVDAERLRYLENHDELASMVLDQWRKSALMDVFSGFDIVNNVAKLKSIDDVPDELRSCVVGVKNTSDGIEVKFMDKSKSLDSIARVLGMFVEKTQNVNSDYESIVDKLARSGKDAG